MNTKSNYVETISDYLLKIGVDESVVDSTAEMIVSYWTDEDGLMTESLDKVICGMR